MCILDDTEGAALESSHVSESPAIEREIDAQEKCEVLLWTLHSREAQPRAHKTEIFPKVKK